MRRTRAFAVIACLAAFALTGCGLNPSGNGTGTTLRVANLMPQPSSVTVQAGDGAFLNNAPFETLGGYENITAGTYTFTITLGESATPAFSAVYPLANVSAYTFIAYGPATATAGLLLDDTLLVHIPLGNFGFRLANVSPTAGPIDAYLTAPGADLATSSPVVSAALYTNSSNFINTAPGTYRLRLTRSGTKEVIFDAMLPPAPDGGGQTVIAYTRGSARLVNVALFTDGSAPTLLPNALARMRAVNGSSVPSALNLFVNGNLTFANVPYANITNYQNVASGPSTVTVEATATPGSTLLSTAPALSPATDTSIALYGDAGTLSALILDDQNISSLVAQATLRFVNISPALPSADIYANGTIVAAGVTQNTASSYVLVAAATGGTTYRFDFDLAGTTTPVLTLPGVTLTAAGVYTVYLIGAPGAVQAIVTQDF
jgi:hypothetical protein